MGNLNFFIEDVGCFQQGPYYGADLGPFSGDGSGSPTLHGVDGTVFVIDDTTIQIIGFSYDGQGPGKCDMQYCVCIFNY